MSSYKEAVEEFGPELAAALCEEEYNQFVRGIEQTPADFYPFEDNDNYIDLLESIGHRRIKANYEKLYRMAEGV